jgi:hypothetical protein
MKDARSDDRSLIHRQVRLRIDSHKVYSRLVVKDETDLLVFGGIFWASWNVTMVRCASYRSDGSDYGLAKIKNGGKGLVVF